MTDMAQQNDILLAEDDNDDVIFFEMALKELAVPYMMRHADNGELLFVLLKEKIPYLLFLDIHMPCKEGTACIQEIRKNREYDGMPVIMYTSNFSNKVIEECYRSGANLYMTKTNTFSDLIQKLRKVFSLNWNDYMHYPAQNQFVLS